jgi:hypothetical protein
MKRGSYRRADGDMGAKGTYSESSSLAEVWGQKILVGAPIPTEIPLLLLEEKEVLRAVSAYEEALQ